MREKRELGRPWSVAVVSARPGEGATLVTATAGVMIDHRTGPGGQNVILMDADLLTGGLTSLLRAWQVPGTDDAYGVGARAGDGGGGLVGYALDRERRLRDRGIQHRLQELRSSDGRDGDMNLLAMRAPGSAALTTLGDLPDVMGRAVERLGEIAGCLLVDCGHGWNARTRRICETVEHIFVVGRADARAHPDTLRLFGHLERAGLLPKTVGHLANSPEPAHFAHGFGRRHTTNGHGPGPLAGLPGQGANSAPRQGRRGDTLPVRTLFGLPYDPRAADEIAKGALPGAHSPFWTALCQGMEALEPDLFRTGFDIY
ncbi:hypothetical protein ACFY93_14830 [Streptomyces sp. NPDC008313]|uniref:hypothetical protein n=1 Tax=Streptomyces sp. NPDC008313 TaxID=3364826 RepID=UPI0036E74C62